MMNLEVFEKAIELWGKEAQVEMIIEECAELILALQKLKRPHRTKEEYNKKIENIHEEIADVKIMLMQAELVFDTKVIDKILKEKINRLKQRLDYE